MFSIAPDIRSARELKKNFHAEFISSSRILVSQTLAAILMMTIIMITGTTTSLLDKQGKNRLQILRSFSYKGFSGGHVGKSLNPKP